MISIDKAKALKEAGLVWEPQGLDLAVSTTGGNKIGVVSELMGDDTNQSYVFVLRYLNGDFQVNWPHHSIWLPRLDQLLEQIEKRGYWPLVYKINNGYECDLSQGDILARGGTTQQTWEDAAAEVLLWILRKKGRDPMAG